MARTAEDIVRMEVFYCVSSLVSTLAQGCVAVESTELSELAEQAFELACPIDDWEEAAIQEGWYRGNATGIFQHKHSDATRPFGGDWQRLCEAEDIEPYDREVFEHWIVSDWLADRLAEKGEKVDKDFAGMTVWARTTTGQGIASDSVMEQIAADLEQRS